MVFGKFLGDKKLDAQRAGLEQSRALLADLERRIRDSDDLYEQFAAVWGDGVPQELTDRLAKARELAGLLHQRVAMAKRELPNFDDAAGLLQRDLKGIEGQWNAFAAILLARKTIVGDGPADPLPGTEACQRALLGLAEEMFRGVRVHLDELAGILPGPAEPWPRELDLAVLERGMTDVRGALDVYAGRLADGSGELPEASTVTLFEIVTRLQNTLTAIEEQRVQMAMGMAMRYAMANTGLR